MKPVTDAEMDESTKLASECRKKIMAYLAYQGSDQRYYHQAKIAAVGLFFVVRAIALRVSPTKLSRQERRHLHAMALEEEEADRVYGSDDVQPLDRSDGVH